MEFPPSLDLFFAYTYLPYARIPIFPVDLYLFIWEVIKKKSTEKNYLGLFKQRHPRKSPPFVPEAGDDPKTKLIKLI